MDSKPKARGPTKKTAKTKKVKSQRERFIEAARAIGVDETEFEKALGQIVPAKKVTVGLS